MRMRARRTGSASCKQLEKRLPPPGDEVGERVAVEDGEERGERLAERRAQPAPALDRARARRRIEAFRQRHAFLCRANDVADPDLLGRPAELEAAPAPPH